MSLKKLYSPFNGYFIHDARDCVSDNNPIPIMHLIIPFLFIASLSAPARQLRACAVAMGRTESRTARQAKRRKVSAGERLARHGLATPSSPARRLLRVFAYRRKRFKALITILFGGFLSVKDLSMLCLRFKSCANDSRYSKFCKILNYLNRIHIFMHITSKNRCAICHTR